MITVSLVDDHIVLRDGLATLIDQFDGCKVVSRAANGQELIEQITTDGSPDIVILDLMMPVMDGYQTAKWLNKHHPDTRVLMLTMYHTEIIMVRLLRTGVHGFLKKDVHPAELKLALQSVMDDGYYYSGNSSERIANLFRPGSRATLENTMLDEREIEFIRLACSELTYNDIAIKMKVSFGAIDNLRNTLFEKLGIKTRVMLVMYAFRNGLVTL
jgi:DNA-binding NarL/FixJ family response regulator